MKHTRVWIGLVVVSAVALFVGAKSVAKWRPTKIGALDASIANNAALDLGVSSRAVVAGTDSTYTRFDLQTGATKLLGNATFMAGDEWLGFLEVSDHIELKIRRVGSPSAIYHAPTPKAGDPNLVSIGQIPAFVRVTPPENRVEMVQGGAYHRWNQSSRALERTVALQGNLGHAQAVSRDGETVICAATDAIYRNATRSAQKPVKVAFQGVEVTKERQLSPFGSYAIYSDTEIAGGQSTPVLRVLETVKGHQLWRLEWNSDPSGYHDKAVFSADETLVAIPFTRLNKLEIHDLKSGDLLRTLPLLPNVQAAAFAPDNATLYSVANGVLYRQRAR